MAASHGLALPQLLTQLAHELGALQLMAADMEASVDDVIERHAGSLDARSIQNLQLLDILNQIEGDSVEVHLADAAAPTLIHISVSLWFWITR